MRVRASSPDFWRGQTFDRFDGRTWSVSDDKPRRVGAEPPIPLPPTPDGGEQRGWDRLGGEFVQTYYVERPGPNLVFGANAPDELYFPDKTVFQLSDGSIRAGVQLARGAVYTVVSRRPDATASTLRAADVHAAPDRIRTRYARQAVPERVRALAESVTAGAPTVYGKVRALERWMAGHTRYTLDIPPLPAGANAVEQFLFVERRGFCEQIGTSLVVMLRALGIPARLAVGYAAGERNPFTGLYEVRASDAHAWAEVYFPGVGWQGFDPTANVPLAGDSTGATAGAGLTGYLAAHLPSLPSWTLGALAAMLALGVAGAAAWGLQVRRARRRRGRSRSWADVQLVRLERLGAERGRPRRPSETVREYVGVLDRSWLDRSISGDSRLATVAAAVDAEMFSGSPVDESTRAAAAAALDAAADYAVSVHRLDDCG